jgi:hypothetical protein
LGTDRRVKLCFEWVENDSNHGLCIKCKANGDTNIRDPMDKIGRS